MRVMRKHDPTNKKTTRKTKTIAMTNTFGEHPTLEKEKEPKFTISAEFHHFSQISQFQQIRNTWNICFVTFGYPTNSVAEFSRKGFIYINYLPVLFKLS